MIDQAFGEPIAEIFRQALVKAAVAQKSPAAKKRARQNPSPGDDTCAERALS